MLAEVNSNGYIVRSGLPNNTNRFRYTFETEGNKLVRYAPPKVDGTETLFMAEQPVLGDEVQFKIFTRANKYIQKIDEINIGKEVARSFIVSLNLDADVKNIEYVLTFYDLSVNKDIAHLFRTGPMFVKTDTKGDIIEYYIQFARIPGSDELFEFVQLNKKTNIVESIYRNLGDYLEKEDLQTGEKTKFYSYFSAAGHEKFDSLSKKLENLPLSRESLRFYSEKPNGKDILEYDIYVQMYSSPDGFEETKKGRI